MPSSNERARSLHFAIINFAWGISNLKIFVRGEFPIFKDFVHENFCERGISKLKNFVHGKFPLGNFCVHREFPI